jgi:hypothetical protein
MTLTFSGMEDLAGFAQKHIAIITCAILMKNDFHGKKTLQTQDQIYSNIFLLYAVF